jgi:hypothetical protein
MERSAHLSYRPGELGQLADPLRLVNERRRTPPNAMGAPLSERPHHCFSTQRPNTAYSVGLPAPFLSIISFIFGRVSYTGGSFVMKPISA